MQKKKFLMFLLSVMLLTFIGAGCSPDESSKALKDDKGNVVTLDNKENPTLIFFFTGIG